jgi:hypothetical protein
MSILDGDTGELMTIPSEVSNIFLSGPMTGVPEWNHPLFNRVAIELRLAGFAVCNPAEFYEGDTTRDRAEYMRESMTGLLKSDMVVALPGWQQSKGAVVELAVALQLDLPVVELTDSFTIVVTDE